MVMQRWYMAQGHGLTTQPPAAATGSDRYTVDFEASTGDRNRWWELGGIKKQTVFYPRRAEAAAHLLTYLTPPLAEDTEITGHPVVTLYVTSTASDGAFFVYLEDVAPDGHVTYVTEGELRAIHRKISPGPAPYKMLAPYHSFKRADVMPLIPGEVAELSFGLLPTSALIRKGHRIRIGIAGHDAGTFVRIPSSGTPVITVERNSAHASFIDLPVAEST
jgi:putative CocE/NonD family hydrolase